MTARLLSLAIAFSMLSITSLSAKSFAALSSDQRITRELTVAAVGDEIRKNCPSISGNMFIAIQKALSLREYAMNLGFSGSEIDDFVNNDTERARIFALRDQFLQTNGVAKGNVQSYCTLGKREIANGSLLGSLLKQK